MIIEVTEIVQDIDGGEATLVLAIKEGPLSFDDIQIPVSQDSADKILQARDAVEVASKMLEDQRKCHYAMMKTFWGI